MSPGERKERRINFFLFHPVAALICWPLTLLSLLYCLITIIRRQYYQQMYQVKLGYEKGAPIIFSVGNIVAGGTGKTPFTIFLARYFSAQNLKVAVIVRGYRRKHKNPEEVIQVQVNNFAENYVQMVGDEAVLLANRLTMTTIFSSPLRQKVIDGYRDQFDIFIFDDGFQHLKAPRHFDFVLLDGKNPFSNRRCLPRGLLREPLKHLQYADCLVVTDTYSHEAGDNSVSAPVSHLAAKYPSKPLVSVYRQVTRLRLLHTNQERRVEFVAGKKILAFCSIGNSRQFMQTIYQFKPLHVNFLSFADHHWYSNQDLSDIKRAATAVDIIITTAKDEVKLPVDKFGSTISFCLDIEIQMKKEDEDRFTRLMERFRR